MGVEMREWKIVRNYVIPALILVIPNLIYFWLLFPLDVRYENISPAITVISLLLYYQSAAFINKDADFKDVIFRPPDIKRDRLIVYLSETVAFFLMSAMMFFINLSKFQTFLLFFIALGLWYGLMYVFGSADLKMRIKWDIQYPIRRRESEE